MLRPKQRDPEIDDRQARAADGVWVQGATVEVGTFHEEVWEGACGAKPPYLRPEMTLGDRGVEVEDALSFDDGVGADGVVAGRECGALHERAKLPQEGGDPARLFMGVCNDPYRRLVIHGCRLV